MELIGLEEDAVAIEGVIYSLSANYGPVRGAVGFGYLVQG